MGGSSLKLEQSACSSLLNTSVNTKWTNAPVPLFWLIVKIRGFIDIDICKENILLWGRFVSVCLRIGAAAYRLF